MFIKGVALSINSVYTRGNYKPKTLKSLHLNSIFSGKTAQKCITTDLIWQWNVIGISCGSLAVASAHLCLCMYQSTLGVTSLPPTMYNRIRSKMVHWLLGCELWGSWYFSNNLPSMCLSLLDQGCVAEAARKESRQIPASKQVRSPQIQKSRGSVDIVCECERGREVKDVGIAVTPTWLMSSCTYTCTKHLIAPLQKRKKASEAQFCLIHLALISPFGDNCLCVNYIPPGALINTHMFWAHASIDNTHGRGRTIPCPHKSAPAWGVKRCNRLYNWASLSTSNQHGNQTVVKCTNHLWV